MLDHDIRDRGVRDERVLAAFEAVPREHFVPAALRAFAFDDKPLPIGHGQTISQPYIIAYMLEQLDVQTSHKVLEVGAGSGYVVALLVHLCKTVVGTERVKELVTLANNNLKNIHKKNYKILLTEKELGAANEAPYDRIIVSATADELPQALVDQLKENGVMLIPLDDGWMQWLYKITKKKGTVKKEQLLGVRFVPLVEE